MCLQCVYPADVNAQREEAAVQEGGAGGGETLRHDQRRPGRPQPCGQCLCPGFRACDPYDGVVVHYADCDIKHN